MSNIMRTTYDPVLDAFHITVDWVMDTEESFHEWVRQLEVATAAGAGKKADYLIDLTDFHVDARFAPRYGQAIRDWSGRQVRHLVRYGRVDAQTRSRVVLSAMANRYAANVCSSREEAEAMLQKLRATK